MRLPQNFRTKASLLLLGATTMASDISHSGELHSKQKPVIGVQQTVSPQVLAQAPKVFQPKPNLKDSNVDQKSATAPGKMEIITVSNINDEEVINKAKLPQSYKDWLLSNVKKIREEAKEEIANAAKEKRAPVKFFLITPFIVKDLEIIHSRIMFLKHKGLVTETDVPLLIDALGFSKFTVTERFVPTLGKQKAFHLSTSEAAPKLKAWLERANDPKQIENVRQEIQKVLKPVEKTNIQNEELEEIKLPSTHVASAGDSEPAKIFHVKPEVKAERKISPHELAQAPAPEEKLTPPPVKDPNVDPKELDAVIKDISKMRPYLGAVPNSLKSEDQQLIEKSTKLTKKDKDLLLTTLKKIEEENKLETAKAKEQKKDPVAVFLITPQVIKDLEIVQFKMECLRDRGVITEEQIPQLKDALGFSKLSSEESSVPAFGVMLKQRRYSFFFAEGSKLDAWIKRSDDLNEKSKLQEEIKAKIKEGHTPVKKFKIDPRGIDFPDRLISA